MPDSDPRAVPDRSGVLRRLGVGGRTEEFSPDQLTPAAAEVAIALEPVEWLYVFDPADRQIARFVGTADQVDLSDDLKAQTGELGLYGEAFLKDHLIVHNHPPRMGDDPVASFPPSPSDLAMAVVCDLRKLVVISGSIRYVLQRPGSVWPFDEELLDAAIREINAEFDETDLEPRRRGSVERQERILHRLDAMGVIGYEKVAGPRGV